MITLVGIGVKKEDISQEALAAIAKSDVVYLEYYTSFYQDSLEELSEYVGKPVKQVFRSFVEQQIDAILEQGKTSTISLLVIGDPLLATTHVDILTRCSELGVPTHVIHGISVCNLVARTGLQMYKFGKTISLPFTQGEYLPTSPFSYFLQNVSIAAHTLFLLDLDPEGGTHLSILGAIDLLFSMQKKLVEEQDIDSVLTVDTFAVACSRLGRSDETIIFGTLSDLQEKCKNLQPPLCLIVPQKMHFMEEEFLQQFS